MPFRQVATAGGFDPLIRRFESCKGSFIREYPRGDGIRLIHVNAVGSSPTSRIRTRLRRIRSLSHPSLAEMGEIEVSHIMCILETKTRTKTNSPLAVS